MPVITRRGSRIPILPSVRQQKLAKAKADREKKMADELKALQRRCEFNTAKVSRIKTNLMKVDDEQIPIDEYVLDTFLRTIDAAYLDMNDCQAKIFAATPTKEDEEEKKYLDFEELYTEVRAQVCRQLDVHRKRQELQVNSGLQVVSSAPQIRVQQSVLPHTPLPTFDGKPEHWFKFKSIFLDIMRKCPSEDAATKLYHLDKCLIGEAAGAINQQFINENNFDGAWNFLQQRYEDKRKIVDIHAIRLLQLKPMTQESGKQLRELIEECVRHVDSLRYHGYDVLGLSDILLVNVIASRLDFETKKLWEATNKHGEIPTYADTISFLERHTQVLERVEASQQKGKQKPSGVVHTQKPQTKSTTLTVTSETKCVFCEKAHFNHQCEELLKLSATDRNAKAKQAGVCYNCLRKGHITTKCSSKHSCRDCNKRHHTVLHIDIPKPSDDTSKSTEVQSLETGKASTNTSNVVTLNCATSTNRQEAVLLSTAVVNILDVHGQTKLCRVLLDSGSQLHLITEAMANLLGIGRTRCSTSVVGINGKETPIKHKLEVEFGSRISDYTQRIDCLIVPRIASILPASKLDAFELIIPDGVVLADPNFYKPQRIDLLIGAELFFCILKTGQIQLGDKLPVLQETTLGWVVSGPVSGQSSYRQAQNCHTALSDPDHHQLEQLIQRFWELEEVPTASKLSSEEQLCEQHYQQTTTRDSSGRYVVMLPFRDSPNKLGESRQQAVRRFGHLERRLASNVELKQQYDSFIEEYIRLNHCEENPEPEVSSSPNFYLPHHAILKPSSSSTKLRTVFDASAKSSTGVSLNDLLMIGPVVQDSLLNIMMRFRIHRYVFSSDISKMYRQTRMHVDHQKFQKIVWRKNPADPLQTYNLTTVTYGTASAPFAATRTLNQLAADEGSKFPLAAAVIVHDFYVDDVLSGGDSVNEIRTIADQLTQLLHCGGFQLHKWCSNSSEFIESIPEELREKQGPLEISGANDVIKTLGLLWNPSSDELAFRIKPVQQQTVITKRHVLSEVSKIYDPLGLLAPATLVAKLLMRELWKLKIGWDEEVPTEQQNKWVNFITSLTKTAGMTINRHVLADNRIAIELHAFSDASLAAYGTCVYVRSIFPNGTAEMHLLTSKSKVAPNQTIPRLELCAFLLMCRLVKAVTSALNLDFSNIVLWTDSQIVLCWLKKSPHELNTFVANRVAEAQRSTEGYQYKYVRSALNPADMVSRGVAPEELMHNDAWWHGPSFLQTTTYPEFESVEEIEVPDVKAVSLPVSSPSVDFPVLERYSSFRKLRRVMAYAARFIRKARKIRTAGDNEPFPTVEEFKVSLDMIVSLVQRQHYGKDIKQVQQYQKTKNVEDKYVGDLRYLNPIYEAGILRVGGRIKHANLSFGQRHPIILPSKHHVTKAIINDFHETYLHIGPSGLLSVLRQRFWIVDGRNVIQKQLRKCVRCFRVNPPDVKRFMGDLPKYRVTQADVFSRVGVDYGGPFLIKTGNPRKPVYVKTYIALFICMVTKAIHIELAVDLSTQAFINVLKRFVARRGVPTQIHSDNATNFIGTNSALHELYVLFNQKETKQALNDYCLPQEIKWCFIPARSPEFGGVWEAGIKSAKHHIKRVVGDAKYSYDEWNTLTTQIEAILNSRPLVPQSSDPSDLKAITPGHILIGRELTAIPEPALDDVKLSTLSRYQLIQRMRDEFWKRWSHDYLQELQRRPKHNKHTEVKVGDLVVLKEENVPPQQWRLGRVVGASPGSDGITRAVKVKTSSGVFSRTTAKLAVLPLDD